MFTFPGVHPIFLSLRVPGATTHQFSPCSRHPLRQQFPSRNRQPSQQQQQQLERCFLQFTEASRNKSFYGGS